MPYLHDLVHLIIKARLACLHVVDLIEQLLAGLVLCQQVVTRLPAQGLLDSLQMVAQQARAALRLVLDRSAAECYGYNSEGMEDSSPAKVVDSVQAVGFNAARYLSTCEG